MSQVKTIQTSHSARRATKRRSFRAKPLLKQGVHSGTHWTNSGLRGVRAIVGQIGEQIKAQLQAEPAETAGKRHEFRFNLIVEGKELFLDTAEQPVAKKPFDPHAAGRELVARLQEAEGGAWTGAELASLFGLSSANLHKRRSEFRIVSWTDAKNHFHYPKWQFNPAGALLPGVQEVLQIFRSSDEWRVMSYFLSPRQQLDDQTPLDLLRAGKVDKVVAHAKAHGEENTW